MNDPFNLERFVNAQNPVFSGVREELRQGYKEGHWMWFVFPQLTGLGSSWMANKFGISCREEAEAYMTHPTLGPRLVECTELVNGVKDCSIEEIFGDIDTLKFRSSMTLFSHVALGNAIFKNALDKYFAGQADQLTLDRL